MEGGRVCLWSQYRHRVPGVLFYWPSSSYELTHSQLVDDILDFSSSTALGKPGSGADLRLGIATGPVLYAAEEYPELEPLIAREFRNNGDVERVSVTASFSLRQRRSHTRIGSVLNPCFVWHLPHARPRTSICRKGEGSARSTPCERGKGSIGGVDGWGCQARVVSVPLGQPRRGVVETKTLLAWIPCK